MEIKIRSKVAIGIDPDSDRSGLAVIKDGELTKCKALPFPALLREISAEIKASPMPVDIYLEAGWLNTGNWHLAPRMTTAKASKMGEGLGSCHQTGKLIQQMLEDAGYPVTLVKPFRKCWSGPDRKITARELEQVIGQPLPKRTNQEMRDATLIAWCCGGFNAKINRLCCKRK